VKVVFVGKFPLITSLGIGKKLLLENCFFFLLSSRQFADKFLLADQKNITKLAKQEKTTKKESNKSKSENREESEKSFQGSSDGESL
jgi:hypothetical protein